MDRKVIYLRVPGSGLVDSRSLTMIKHFARICKNFYLLRTTRLGLVPV